MVAEIDQPVGEQTQIEDNGTFSRPAIDDVEQLVDDEDGKRHIVRDCRNSLFPCLVQCSASGFFLTARHVATSKSAPMLRQGLCDDLSARQTKHDHGPRDHDRAEEQNQRNVLMFGRGSPTGSWAIHDFTMTLLHPQSNCRWAVHEDVDHQDLCRRERQFPTQHQGAHEEKKHGGNVGSKSDSVQNSGCWSRSCGLLPPLGRCSRSCRLGGSCLRRLWPRR